jgi:competence protein ComEC
LQPSKINWKSKLFSPGFFLLTALLLVDLSFLIYQSNAKLQKLTAIIIAAYLLFLLLRKYNTLKFIVFGLLAVGFISVNLNNRKDAFSLKEDTVIKVYPDQVKLKDGWMSATGSAGKDKILVSGNVSKDDEKLIEQGRTLFLTNIAGDVTEITPATNYGEFDYRKYYASKNISQKIKLQHYDLITGPNNLIDKLHSFRFNLQSYFKKMPRILAFFSSELLLAENPSTDNQEILNNYRDLGVIHILSISGLHVGIYTLLVSAVCFWLKFTEEETFLCCSFILLIGIFLSNGQAGFIRASLSYILSKLFRFKKWQIVQADVLGLTCLLHLLVDPRLFMGVGAILSYVLVFGLQLTNKLSSFKQSVALNLLLTPLLLFYFFQFNLLTVIFNMLIVPYFDWVVMPVTFINLILFKFMPSGANFLELILKNGEQLIGKLSATKLGLFTFGKISWWQCLLLLFMTAIFLIVVNEKKENKKLKREIAIGTLGIYIVFFCLIHFPIKGQVTFIDVGQGDSILITTPFPRKVYMIDTGGKLNFTGKKMTPQVNKITLPFLKAQGISQIDGLFVSHQDADHVGDLGPLLEQVKVKKLYMAQGLIANPSFQKRIDGKIRHTKLVELLEGMHVKEPKINFSVVYPFKAGEGKNEDSLSLAFELANKRWMFTGDLGQDGEKEIMNKIGIQVDYFKLGHHGSKTSSNPEFLKSLQPKEVFISAGRKNRFGHPHPETLATLKKQQIPWVSTQDCGMISWTYGGFTKPEFKHFLAVDDQ